MEKNVPKNMMQIGESFEQRYQPVLDFEGWRVAMLRHMPDTDFSNLKVVERHNETNEVFILTEGNADLIVCENGEKPGKIFVFPMRKNVAYNFGKNVWHHVLMSEDAHIILFERTNTTLENTDYHELSESDVQYIKNNSQFMQK